jgi:hypothetical protein
MFNVRSSFITLLLAAFGGALAATGCAGAPDPSEGPVTVTAEESSVEPAWTHTLSPRVMLTFGQFANVFERLECGALNGVSETVKVGECTIRVTNANCQTAWSDFYSEYVCVCDQLASSVSGC